MKTKLFSILCFCLCISGCNNTHKTTGYYAIHSGVAWFDQNNNEVNAHGACIVQEGNTYYLFGEYKSDTTNAFGGFSCYSSTDLMNWQFERIVLPLQKEGLLGPNRVGERVKVMECPSTGEFVMYMHTDDMKYTDPHVGYAICPTISGEYQFHGELLHEGKYLRKWDLGTFQDTDGKGYLLTHEGFIYELAEDYKSVSRIIAAHEAPGGESPAMFKKNGVYFWLFSNKTSWERNDNYYLTATSLQGPWSRHGHFAPEGTLTWNSQCSFVFPVVNEKDTLHLYMGDRWSFPKQGSAGTYVWLPVTVEGDSMSLPEFYDAWRIDSSAKHGWLPAEAKTKSVKDTGITTQGNWEISQGIAQSNEKGATVTYNFKGRQIGIKALMNKTSGYAKVTIKNSSDKEIISTIVDFYSNYENVSHNFLSPVLASDNYMLTIEVMGEHPKWADKRKNDYGSTDNYVRVVDVLVYEK